MRVGILEDDVAIQEMLLMVLLDEGYTVINYANARECLQALLPVSARNQSPIEFLIIDWRLGNDIPGTEVIRQVRNNPCLSTLPIILMTAATFSDIEILKNLQITLLEKPFAVDEMSTMIQEMVQAEGTHIENSYM